MTEAIAVKRSIVINADRERIWQALTDAAQVSKWFDSSMTWEFKLGIGEPITYWMNGEVLGKGRIVTVDSPERFAFNWTPEPGNPAETLVTFTLERVAEGTRVTVVEAGFEVLPADRQQPRVEENSDGWRQVLDHLVTYLEKDRA
jgi:uncharacterized protein YndB with AHSA1/START domain